MKRMVLKINWLCMAALCCVGMLMAGCAPPDVVDEEPVEKPVRVMKVEEDAFSRTLSYTGEVVPGETIQLSFQVSGRIQDLYVEKEDLITQGTLLAQIDPLDYRIGLESAQARLNAAQASLDQIVAGARAEEIRQAELELEKAREAAAFIQKQLERMEALYVAGAATQAELDEVTLEAANTQSSLEQAESELEKILAGARVEEIDALRAQRDAARAELRHYETQLNRTELKADTDGRISEIFYKGGEMYGEGTPFLALRSDKTKVQLSVSRHEIRDIHIGDSAEIRIDDEIYSSQVVTVSRNPDPLTRTFPVEISLPDAEFIAGSIARVTIHIGEASGTEIPISAVQSGDPDYVYIVEEGEAVKIPVEILGLTDDSLWVSGLSAGQMVVVEGMGNLEDGEPVRIREAGDVS